MVRSDSSHSRVTVLEMEFQNMNEKVDELSSALNESMEEIEDLQADVVFKEGRIASLEKEIRFARRIGIVAAFRGTWPGQTKLWHVH